jgi:hypothetical protein
MLGGSRLLAIGLSAALLLGCSGPPAIARYTLVTTDRSPLQLEILKEKASGWSCTISPFYDAFYQVALRELGRSIPSRAYAVEMALRTVPGAELLVDTSTTRTFTTYLLWNKQCVAVTGKAARLLPAPVAGESAGLRP